MHPWRSQEWLPGIADILTTLSVFRVRSLRICLLKALSGAIFDGRHGHVLARWPAPHQQRASGPAPIEVTLRASDLIINEEFPSSSSVLPDVVFNQQRAALNDAASGMIDWTVVAEFIGGGIIGGVLGMLPATRLSAQKDTLNRIFAALICMVATYVLCRSGSTYWSR